MGAVNIRAIRGATTVEHHDVDEVYDATRELLAEMLSRNDVDSADLISILFTTSPDLTAAFPATAARSLGLIDVPLMCASEIDVPGALPRCIRIMMHTYSPLSRAEVRHVYLRDAVALRSDLV